jgi:hypothetical protein
MKKTSRRGQSTLGELNAAASPEGQNTDRLRDLKTTTEGSETVEY